MSFKKGEVVIYNNEARIVEKVDKISIDGLGEAVRELKSDTSESYDLKAISEIAIENEAFSSKNSLKNAVEYIDDFQSVSSRHLENEFLDGLGGKFRNFAHNKF